MSDGGSRQSQADKPIAGGDEGIEGNAAGAGLGHGLGVKGDSG